MQKTWWKTVLKRGAERLALGLLAGVTVAACIFGITWWLANLMSLLIVGPAQLREPVSTGILACKALLIGLAAIAGSGTPD